MTQRDSVLDQAASMGATPGVPREMSVPSPKALERALAGSTAAEIVLLAQYSERTGAPDIAVAICEAALRLGIDDPTVVLTEAVSLFVIGERAKALALVESVLDRSAGHLAALNAKARMLGAVGRRDESLAIFHQVVERFPDCPGAHTAVASLLLPGLPYDRVLAHIHRLRAPDTYLEIGVDRGGTLELAVTASIKAGVDPEPLQTLQSSPSLRFYQLESDAFFAQESTATVFDGRPVDLTFIDGMHQFEYALRDFMNAERWASADGLIILHDCLPVTLVAARHERESRFWVGDVWKVLDVLLEYRPDLRIATIPTPPSGLVIVSHLDPQSQVLARETNSILARYTDCAYPHVPGAWPARYSIVSNDEAGIAVALG